MTDVIVTPFGESPTVVVSPADDTPVTIVVPVGLQGPAGQGVPTGGSAGQILSKISSSNFDSGWVTLPSPVAGTDTQIQFNDNGVLGGSAKLLWDKTNNTLIFSGVGGSSTPNIKGTTSFNMQSPEFTWCTTAGAWAMWLQSTNLTLNGGRTFGISAGNGAADVIIARGGPNILEQRNGVSPQTWRLYVNYSDASNLSRFYVQATASVINIATESLGSGGGALPIKMIPGVGADLFLGCRGSGRLMVGASALVPDSTTNAYDIGAASTTYRNGYFGTSVVTPTLTGGTADLSVAGANYVSVITAGVSRWYWTPQGHLDAQTPNTYDIGKGVAPRSIYASTSVVAPTHQTTDTTVASLPTPSVSNRGQRRHVTDSAVSAAGNFGAIVTAGGSFVVPVFCTGVDWIIA